MRKFYDGKEVYIICSNEFEWNTLQDFILLSNYHWYSVIKHNYDNTYSILVLNHYQNNQFLLAKTKDNIMGIKSINFSEFENDYMINEDLLKAREIIYKD